MLVPGSANPHFLGAPAGGAAGYSIPRSLRFNPPDSAYLSRAVASIGNRKTYTLSLWLKRSALGNGSTIYTFASGNTALNTGTLTFGFSAADTLRINNNGNAVYQSTAVYRDASAWYNIVISCDTTKSTDFFILYVNGVESFRTNAGYAQNNDTGFNNSVTHSIGSASGSSQFFDGYLADVYFIDGQALTPTSFGAFDATTGVWNPKAYTGTYGTNGFHLPFSDNSAATAAALGKDTSGNSNNWTPNNLSVTAGAGNDSLVDSPTNGTASSGGDAGGTVVGNYCTINAVDNGGVTLSDGNLQAANGSNVLIRGTISVSSGKWYYECTPTVVSGAFVIGVATPQASLSYLGVDAYGWGYTGASGGLKYNAGGSGAYGSSIAANDVIGVAIDMDAKTLTFYKNNTSLGTAYSNLTGSVAPAFSGGAGSTCVFNFGQRPFAYAAPAGFKSLNTANLPTPTILAGNTAFDTKLYTGNGGTQSITGLAFSPDLVWLKARNYNSGHALWDVIRGAQQYLGSESTSQELTIANTLTSFDTTGFSLGSYSGTNGSAITFAAWCWDAGTSNATNTSGSITSTVRANISAGFSVVTYTGTGSNATVGHGLGVAPSFYVVKARSNAYNWQCYHSDLGGTIGIQLNLTNGSAAESTFWNNTNPTSSVFSIGTNVGTNQNSATYVAYCWAPVVGYSAFGSYTGNGSADGVFVYTGMRPRWVIVKRRDTTSNWTIIDTARAGYNVDNDPLYPNLSNAEGTTDLADILSNGFKLRTTDASVNASSGTYVWAAFAENPFSIARAR